MNVIKDENGDCFGVDFVYSPTKNKNKPIDLYMKDSIYDCLSQSFTESIVRSKAANYIEGISQFLNADGIKINSIKKLIF